MNAQTKITPDLRLAPEVVTTEELFAGASLLTIQHQDMEYTLRITRQGKLLLTK